MARHKSDSVFIIKKRWLRRTVVSTAEYISGLTLMAAIALSGLWFFTRKDDYKPEERDLDPSLLADKNTLELYTRPLKVWREPGAAVAAGEAPTIEPFPPSVLDERWRISGRVKSFVADNLFEKINGEAEKFLTQNFQKLNYLVLQSKQDNTEIAIELFDHDDVASSIGIFSAHASADSEVLNAGPVSYFLTGAGMIGRKGKYFFRVAATQLNDSVSEKVTQLISAFSNLEENANDMPVEYRVLSENLNIPGNAIAYTPENVFQYDFAKNFWFGALPGEEGAQAFIHAGDSAAATEELYQLLLSEFEFDYEVVDSFENTAILKHRFLDTFLVMQQMGPNLFGVDNLASRDSVPDLMGNLSQGLGELAE